MGLSDLAVAAVAVADVERRYVSVVVDQPRLQGVTSAFEGETVR